MASTDSDTPTLPQRPKRADARRNYEKLIAAAHDAFAQDGTSASLEDIARRAEVGIGTLYRHFPTRQHLLESVYLEEVEAICRSAEDFAGLPPWDALSGWLHAFVGFAATKKALAEEMFHYIDRDAAVFQTCGSAITTVGDELLKRAQDAGEVRPDTDFTDIGRLVGGISVIRATDSDQIRRILDVALDGLRYRPPGGS